MYFKTVIEESNLMLEKIDKLLSESSLKTNKLFNYAFVDDGEDKFIKYSLKPDEIRFNFIWEEGDRIEIVSDIRYDKFDINFNTYFDTVLHSHYLILERILGNLTNVKIGFVLKKKEDFNFYQKVINLLFKGKMDFITLIHLAKFNNLNGYNYYTSYLFRPILDIMNGNLLEMEIILDVKFAEAINTKILINNYKHLVSRELNDFIEFYRTIDVRKESFFDKLIFWKK